MAPAITRTAGGGKTGRHSSFMAASHLRSSRGHKSRNGKPLQGFRYRSFDAAPASLRRPTTDSQSVLMTWRFVMKAPGILLFSVATIALAGIGVARAGSVAPVGGDSFNVKAQIDL